MTMPPDLDDATLANLMMHRLKRRVYGCALVCLVLATPVICFAITLESIWARLATLALLGIAPMVEEFPLSEVNKAIDRLENGSPRYRVVLKA